MILWTVALGVGAVLEGASVRLVCVTMTLRLPSLGNSHTRLEAYVSFRTHARHTLPRIGALFLRRQTRAVKAAAFFPTGC